MNGLEWWLIQIGRWDQAGADAVVVAYIARRAWLGRKRRRR